MSLKIHVFVATNKGLIALQNMIDLKDISLQSVITIKGSTDLAGISPAYHRFVQKTTGLIQKEFGGHSFRTNISRNIDQGNSWQLPFYIAHFINSVISRSFQLGDGIVQTGDIVLIATGQVNTSSGLIEAVKHIPDKFITASAQIKLWMKKGVLVEFVMPANNQSDQLPELDCVICPVLTTQQVREHVENLLPIKLSPDEDINSDAPLNQQSTDKQPIEIVNGPAKVVSSQNKEARQSGLPLSDKQERSPITLRYSGLSEAVGGLSGLKISMLVFFLLTISVLFLSREYLFDYDYALKTRFAISKKSSPYCDTNAELQLTSISSQYVSRVPAIGMKEACSITLITSDNMPQVWLIADTKVLIELERKLIDGEAHWTIPIPTQQHTDREYILILTYEYLDLADLAAFKTVLSRLEKTQKPTIELLADFFTQIAVNPQYVSQKLVNDNG